MMGSFIDNAESKGYLFRGIMIMRRLFNLTLLSTRIVEQFCPIGSFQASIPIISCSDAFEN